MGEMTVEEAAQVLGVAVQTVRWRIGHGLLKARRIGARLWVIDDIEIERIKAAPPKRGRPKRKADSHDEP